MDTFDSDPWSLSPSGSGAQETWPTYEANWTPDTNVSYDNHDADWSDAYASFDQEAFDEDSALASHTLGAD